MSQKLQIDGRNYLWAKRKVGERDGKPLLAENSFSISLVPATGDPIEIGVASRGRNIRGWRLTARVGGTRRAGESGMGFAISKERACHRLFELARAEASLTIVDKVMQGIIVDGPNGTVIDYSKGLTPIPDENPSEGQGQAVEAAG